MSDLLGLDGILKYNTAGVSSGSWVVLADVRDVTFDVSKETVDTTTRANNGWKAQRGTLKAGELKFTMPWIQGNAGYEAIKDAFMGNEHIGFQFLDSSAEETGFEADFEISNLSYSQPLTGVQDVEVTAYVTYVDTSPAYNDAAP